jgi:hypothetical protein
MGQACVLQLRCPRCGAPFTGLQQDVVFWCGECLVPYEVLGSAFVQRPGHVARPALALEGSILYLPIWALRVQSVALWSDPARERDARHVPPIQWVYVTGFELQHASYFGDPGLTFTEKRVQMEAGDPSPVLGCTRSLAEAKAFAESHILTIIDRRVDVTGLELSATVEDVLLWGVPFFDKGHLVRDGILGLKFPAAAVSDLEAVRGCMRARR